MRISENIHTLSSLYKLLDKNQRNKIVAVFFLIVGLSAIDMMGVASIMPFLAMLADPNVINTNQIIIRLYGFALTHGVEGPVNFLILLGVFVFIIVLCGSCYRIYCAYYINFFVERTRHFLSIRFLNIYLSQPYLFFLKRHTGELSKTVLSEVDEVVGNVLYFVVNMFSGLFIIFALTILLFSINPLMAIGAISVFGVIYFSIYVVFRNKASIAGFRMALSNEKRFKCTDELFSAIKAIQVADSFELYSRPFKESSKIYSESLATKRTLSQVPQYIVEAVAFGGIVLISVGLLIASMASDYTGALGRTLPILGLYTFAAYRMQPALRSIFQGLVSLRYGRRTVLHLADDIKLEKSLPFSNEFFDYSNLADTGLNIEFKNVSFTYGISENMALSNLNLAIPAGSKIGVVGRSGSGKSTFVDLLVGLLCPTEGEVLINGIPLSRISLPNYRKALGYVPQDIVLMDGTIKQNVTLGFNDEAVDIKQVEWSLSTAGILEYVNLNMPNGLDTIVGQKGARLSGGQRQRIGIARALYRNPDIVIFDEATSALDSLTEAEILQNSSVELRNKTLVIVTHRFSALSICDRIIVMDSGRISMFSDYQSLLRSDTVFQSLISAK